MAGRYLVTQSLLSAWKYQFSEFFDMYEDGEKAELARLKAHDDFISSLNRVPTVTNEAMLKGRSFENLVTLIADDEGCGSYSCVESIDPEKKARGKTNWEKWFEHAAKIADIVRGGVFQASINEPLRIGQTEFLLHGKLDVLKQGTIYDIKYSSRYEYGNYHGSAQHPMYMALVPEASKFTYLTYREYSGVFDETYLRDETRDISDIISEFMRYLDARGLTELYEEKWAAL